VSVPSRQWSMCLRGYSFCLCFYRL